MNANYELIMVDLYKRVQDRGNALTKDFDPESSDLLYDDDTLPGLMESVLRQLTQFRGSKHLYQRVQGVSLVHSSIDEKFEGPYLAVTQRLLYEESDYNEKLARVSQKEGFEPISESEDLFRPQLTPSLEIQLSSFGDGEWEFGFAVNPDGSIVWYKPHMFNEPQGQSTMDYEMQLAELAQEHTRYETAFEHFLDLLAEWQPSP